MYWAAAGSEMDQQQNSNSSSSQDAEPKVPGGSRASSQPSQDAKTAEKQPSKLKQLWAKIGLDVPTCMMMFKGSVAPIVALAMYQSPKVAAHYTTLGYLIAIMSILGLPIMPRGKFIQTMSMNVIGVCLGAAVNLLALYTSTQARLHTARPKDAPTAYNSSASAVCAIWLMVQIYLVNYLRSARPQFQFPAIVYSILVIVGMSYGPSFPNMTYAISFTERLIEAFLTGFALATGVHFFIFPVSSRTVVFKEMTGYIMCLEGMLKSQTAYMESMESIDPVALQQKHMDEIKTDPKKAKKFQGPLHTPAADAMRGVFLKLMDLHTKLGGDITPAKREFAIGKMSSKEITQTWKQLRLIFVPILGLSSSIDVLRRHAEQRHWASSELSPEEIQLNKEQIENLHMMMKTLHGPFAEMKDAISAGFKHIMLTLELTKAPKKKLSDEEGNGEKPPAPGSPAFAAWLKTKIDDFHQSKQTTLEQWCQRKGIRIPENFFNESFDPRQEAQGADESVPDRLRNELFFALYMEYQLYRAGRATLDMVLFADKIKQDGKLKRNKLIFPGARTLRKWFKAAIGREDLSRHSEYLTDMEDGASQGLFLGAKFERKRDPEHLPPQNLVEKIGNKIRLIPDFFRSRHSAFGFRVMCATMSVAIINYLHDTQRFFLRHRLLWAMIMIAISMSRLAGQSTWAFSLRIIGTAIAMIASYIIWYIVVGHPAGVFIFLWLWIMIGFYGLLKFPKFVIVAILSVVSTVLIVGYELQVQVLGVAVSESNGQPAYPTYLLAPYRLATVAGGLFVAWIWTIFPYPISESSELRKDLGASLYMLANLTSLIHEVVQSRVKGVEGDVRRKGTHAYNLEKARTTVFGKLVALLTNMRANSAFSQFQVRVGGKFPKEEYEGLIECVQRILNYQALLSYASQGLSLADKSAAEHTAWSNDFRRLVADHHSTSNQTTSILSLLSSCLTNGQALPPYLELPQKYAFARRLESIDKNILSVRHIVEPEYSAFAVLQICGTCVTSDVEKLVNHVRKLVGEMDFSFHALNPSGTSSDASSLNTNEQTKAE